jgi:hypothetical protein
MGVGKTVYKGEVETGVVAWFWSRTDLLAVSRGLIAEVPVGAGLVPQKIPTPRSQRRN